MSEIFERAYAEIIAEETKLTIRYSDCQIAAHTYRRCGANLPRIMTSL
jgi:hypothetical protein